MRKISCLIIDDEPFALDLLEGYVLKTPFLELAGKCSSAIEAMNWMFTHTIDVLFLDIQMPDLSGLEFSRTLKNGPKIIFTTAFERYAVEGYKVDAIDYLLKPFSYEEFLAASSKAKERIEASSEKAMEEEELFVKSDYKIIKIPLKDVLFFEGLKDYVKIYLEGKDAPILSLISLKAIEEKLSEKQFMRVHRSYIIQLAKIEVIEKGRIIIHDTIIPVADNYKERFKNYLSSRSIDF